MTTDRCEIPRCRAEGSITYLGHQLCNNHWQDLSMEELTKALHIQTEPALPAPEQETTMSKKKSSTPKEPKAKKVREPKPPREKIDRTGYRTLALRVPPEEFERAHAGAKKAGENLTAFMHRNIFAAC